MGIEDSQKHVITTDDEDALISFLGDMVTAPVSKGAKRDNIHKEGVTDLWLSPIHGPFSMWTCVISCIAAIEIFTQSSGYFELLNLYVLIPYLYIVIQLIKTATRIGDKINRDFENIETLKGMWETYKDKLMNQAQSRH